MRIQCPQCKALQESGGNFCKGCGMKFEKIDFGPPVAQPTRTPVNWFQMLWVSLSFILLVGICVFSGIKNQPSPSQTNTAETTPFPEPKTPAEYLARAKNLISATYSPIAHRYLQAIPQDAKEYKEAQKLIKEEEK